MTYSFRGIDHVQVAAPPNQEDIAREFYSNKLGFHELQKPENLAKRGGVWFQAGNHQLHIGVENDFTSAKKAHPAFEVKNINDLKTKLIEKNVDVIEDDNLEGAKRFYLQDPFGNRLEFLEWL
ncbi:VOC family protein [Staphylococcus succinus]|uniref:VOC family protein n=1 Tax=Staphylococcus succinus TaxID=61015 RepID=UPI000D1DA87D|nr:VOC family protein [Staphylococcus succinus]PTI44530.1 glyoxalase [Staphylococcus succinus]